ncbi:hypothetical protein F5Y00DRAFT_222897 [Daldinia vernicosa]|uniref:uncharacterized protein n=1 Tax=Daldinia vernicosa TaxID=114800 RepID=UPI002007D590|nr:uncharacterized protein F5Y00DRAFT_222897 [Daldinia vernicosa]KAI0854356.1 hypothetical protein F5Y00DRAFT_222897 [Daldinia vernicosa]
MAPTKKTQWETSPTPSGDDMIDPALSLDSTSTITTSTKRKRASKPKVRTGCITWIRRVKCDETKPACTRCTSTGRKCDGYDGAPPPRPKKPTSSSPDQLATPFSTPTTTSSDGYPGARHDLARNSFAAACRGTSALQILRPLAADIQGTEEERLYFHRFRQAAEAGLALHASSLGASFWRRLVPQVGHSDPAVRHALIALGAAYESMQLQQQQGQHRQEQNYQTTRMKQPAPKMSSRSGSPAERSYVFSTPPPEDAYQCADQLELFMIQQYNLSIYHLQRHVQPGSPSESVEITLICCLLFVCIETSRGNEAAALAHVANGLQIIKALPPDSNSSGRNNESRSSSHQGYSGSGSGSGSMATSLPPRISRSDWRQLLDFFLTLEPSTVTHDFSNSQPASPSCPPAATWENTPEWYSEMISQWEIEAAEGEIRS